MLSFLTSNPAWLFLCNAIAAGALASICCGIIGSFLVARRLTYIAGAIAHSIFAGIGIARYLETAHGLPVSVEMGAVAAALVAGGIISLVRAHVREREDTILSAIWSVGMATGILFLSRSQGYGGDLASYLFGDILLVSTFDLWALIVLDSLVLTLLVCCHHRLLAVAFDEEFARLRKVHTAVYNGMLLICTALTVALLVRIVGILLVVALLSLPAAVAGRLGHSLFITMALAVVISFFCTASGIMVSYAYDLPAGAVIILIAGLLYGAALVTPVKNISCNKTDRL